jgi:CO/xanthine dehydrogenase FAD-binding subunit
VADFVTGAGRSVLDPGELLRSVTLPARALAARTAFRQASLSGLGRSAALLIGTLDPLTGGFALNVTAATVRPFQLRFAGPPSAEELHAAVEREIEPAAYYDDIHGLPAWRRHMTLRLGEEIRRELSADLDDPTGQAPR